VNIIQMMGSQSHEAIYVNFALPPCVVTVCLLPKNVAVIWPEEKLFDS
jgi:hypothetical protein